ncbi:MAG: ribosomal protein S18-alanine N-acetyltransferase [Lachnospiraceae bacterium]|nr:ribosomal protein S18-alanine N-acetyltransferase [Lachnospiraceae bacterium]
MGQADGTKMMIRLMEIGDIPGAAELEKELFSQPWSEKSLKEALERDDSVYAVCIAGGEVAGYCGVYLTGNEGYINNVAVCTKRQGTGIGRQLLSFMLQKAGERGMKACTLEVRPSNERALRLYHSLGFEDAGIRPRFYDKPTEDALIMWLYL